MGIYTSFFNILGTMNLKDPRWFHYLFEFHVTRDYYACHDYLEEKWFELGNPQNHILMAFIMLAVSCYHYRANNLKGAQILIHKAIPIFNLNIEKISEYDIDQIELFKLLDNLQSDLNHHIPFKDINLPFSNKEIEKELQDFAQQHHLICYQVSDMSNLHLIHKHKFKNR